MGWYETMIGTKCLDLDEERSGLDWSVAKVLDGEDRVGEDWIR